MLLADLVAASNEVAETAARSAKVRRLAAVLAAAGPDEVVPAVGFLTGEPRQGSVGVGWASLRSEVAPAAEPTLTVGDLDVMLDSLAGASGPGSRTAKAQVLGELMGRATPDEQRFVRNVLLGELRQGALGGVMVEAVAAAASVPAASVRRALMLTGDLGVVAETALSYGATGLSAFGLEVLRPIQPMLAQSADDLSEAMARFGSAGVEWKLDGARIQAHRAGDEVRVFTRSLADITERAPEVVEALLALPVDTVILDGEAIVLRSDARPLPIPGDDVEVWDPDAEIPLVSWSPSSSTVSTSTAMTCSTCRSTGGQRRFAWPCPRCCVSRGLSPGICRRHRRYSTRPWTSGTRG